MFAARTAQGTELGGQTRDFIVEVEDGDKSRASADGQQQQEGRHDGPDQESDGQIAVGEHGHARAGEAFDLPSEVFRQRSKLHEV
jgi:hypothetical protein